MPALCPVPGLCARYLGSVPGLCGDHTSSFPSSAQLDASELPCSCTQINLSDADAPKQHAVHHHDVLPDYLMTPSPSGKCKRYELLLLLCSTTPGKPQCLCFSVLCLAHPQGLADTGRLQPYYYVHIFSTTAHRVYLRPAGTG